MSEDVEKKSSAEWWIIAVVAALVLYVLSYGPASAFMYKFHRADTAGEMIETFYKPLEFVCERLGATDLMGSYISWWYKVFNVQDPFRVIMLPNIRLSRAA